MSKWLQNVENGRYYPYTDFLAQHNSMIEVYTNPFTTPEPLIEKETIEEAEERIFNSIEEEVIEEKEEVTPKPVPKPAPKRIVKKPVAKKGNQK